MFKNSVTSNPTLSPRTPGLPWKWFIGLTLAYLATHIFALTKLPVFADEAIYIRWAQLIMDDAHRYAFFALNDGKTPLFIWLLVPFQSWFSDQLLAARIVSVIAGLLQMATVIALTRELGGKKVIQLIAGLATIVLPFWFFHHRMALMDGLLVLCLSLSWLALLKAINTRKWGWVITSGVAFGLSLLTKLPAVLFLPALAVAATVPFLTGDLATRPTLNRQNLFSWLLKAGLAVSIGIGLFALLKLNPAFSQLFSRGGDFLFKLDELNLFRIIKNLWDHTNSFLGVFGAYLSWGSVGLLISGAIIPRHRSKILLLGLMALVYLLPIMLVGRVIYPRYLLPAVLPLTIALAFAIEAMIYVATHQPNLVRRALLAALLAVLGAQIIDTSTRFLLYSWLDPKHVGFTPADQVQYLTEWSAGDGIQPVSAAAMATAQRQSLLVLTEGYFGTLPDGILLYLHGKNLQNLFVEGIGQPVNNIPPAMITKAKLYDQVWLVVNSHRMNLSLPPDQLLRQYCRLPGAPCLQVWNLKPYLENLPVSE